MGLKFRRGTNAQKSGSLAFGEPYVNTDLGTLQIGGLTGDITLGASGTGSQGSFAGISGSSLDITGNAKIDGNLRLGGNITIGDQTTDTVNITAALSSSLIPVVTNVADLGSSDKIYRAIYGGNIYGTINATNGVISGSSQLNTLATTGSNTFKGNQTIIGSGAGFAAYISTSVNDATLGLDTTANVNAMYFLKNGEKNFELSYDTTNANGIFRLLPYDNNSFFEIGNPSNSGANYVFISEPTYGNVLIGPGIGNGVSSLVGSTPATDKVQVTGNLYVSGAISANSFTGSIAATNGVVSGSSQVTLSSTTGYSDFSSSLNSRILTEKGRVDAILSAADADKDSFAEIVTLINSVDTTNDNAFASFYTASVGRLNNLESTSGSVNISVSNLNTFSGSALTRLSALEVETANLESFTSSINTTIKNRLDANTVVSGSSQVIGILSSLNTYTGSNDTTNTTQNSRLDQLSTASGSAITRLSALEVETANLETFSSSALTRLSALEVETSNLETFSSSALTRLSNLEGKDISITLTGDVTGTGTITDLANVSFATTIAANSVALGTDTTGDYVASMTAGTGITVGTATGEGSTPVITNTGVTSNVAGNAITVSGATGAVTINHADTSTAANLSATSRTYVTALTFDTYGHVTAYSTGTETVTDTNTVTTNIAGTGVTVSSGTGNSTISIGQAVATSDNVRFNSLGIGMAASATAGRIDATNDIVAFSSSDIRFKENIKPIENAIDKIRKISGNTYDWKEENKIEHGYEGNDVGVIAQEIEAVLPQLVQTRESGYKAVKYDKLVALLIEGIKEQQLQIEQLRIDLDNCRNKGL